MTPATARAKNRERAQIWYMHSALDHRCAKCAAPAEWSDRLQRFLTRCPKHAQRNAARAARGATQVTH